MESDPVADHGPGFPAAGVVMERHDRRAGAAMAAIVGDHHPEPAGLRGPATRIQHRRTSLIDEDAVCLAQMGRHVSDGRERVGSACNTCFTGCRSHPRANVRSRRTWRVSSTRAATISAFTSFPTTPGPGCRGLARGPRACNIHFRAASQNAGTAPRRASPSRRTPWRSHLRAATLFEFVEIFMMRPSAGSHSHTLGADLSQRPHQAIDLLEQFHDGELTETP